MGYKASLRAEHLAHIYKCIKYFGDHGADAGTIIKIMYNKYLGVFEKH